jgi:hypothetical protein
MKLEIHERLALLEILPKQGSYAELKALRKAREIISFTQEEIDFYQLKIGDDKLWHWATAKASQKVLDAPIEQYVAETIRKALAEMESKHAMTEMYTSLYEKFVIAFRTVGP